MEIKINYQLNEESETKSIFLSAEEYFDPIVSGETFEENGVPKYQETCKYIGCSSNDLKWDIIKIICDKGISIFRSQYLDGSRSMMTHSIDFDNSEEIIHSTELEKNNWHIIKMFKPQNGFWSVIMDSLVEETENSENVSKTFIVGKSKNDLNEFMKVN
jgi:hypothetical protein